MRADRFPRALAARLLRVLAGGLLLVLAAAGSPVASAAPVGEGVSGAIPFHVNLATFPGPEGAGETTLYLDVPLTSLHFAGTAEGPPSTTVQVSVVVIDREGRRIAGEEQIDRDLRGSSVREENKGRSLRRRFHFELPAGEMRVRVRVEEQAGEQVPDQAGERELEFTVPSFAGEELAVSDLVFGMCEEEALPASIADLEGPVRPHPSRRYGDDAPVICVLARMVDDLTAADSSYVARYEVKDANGRSREKETVSVPRSGRAGELLLHPRLDGLGLGRYHLRVEVSLDGRKVERSGWFDVDQTRVSFLEDARMLRTVMGYVATNEELLRLEEDLPDSLEALYWRFWERRDPTPETRHNEALVEFMRRVEYARSHFGVLEPGWQSDMGRIHIKFGFPDQVESVLNDSYGAPSQIWYYYNRNTTFVFQDPDGFGKYRLASTRRN